MNTVLKRILYYFIIMSLYGVQASYVYAQEKAQTQLTPLVLNEFQERYSLIGHAEYFIDQTEQLTLGEVIANDNLSFNLIKHNNTTLGHPTQPIWVRIALTNPFSEKKQLNLEIDYARLNYIDFYWQNENGEYEVRSTGLNRHIDTRDKYYKSFVFKITAPAQTTNYYYLKIQSIHAVFIPLAISTQEGFTDHVIKHSYILATFFGIYVAMILYNLFLFISIRDRSYLFYVFFMMSLFYFQFSFFGYNAFLFPEAYWWNNISIIWFIYLATFTGMIFTRDFLQTKNNNPILDKVLLTLIGIDGVLVIACPFLGVEKMATTASISALVISLTDIFAGLRRWYQGYQPAKYYLLSWGVLVTGIMLLIFESLGLIPAFEFMRWSLQIGATGEAVLLSFALAYRINLLKQQNAQSEKESIMAHAESQAKSEFLSKMSHEIRTPLNGMLGMINILKDTHLDKNQEHYIDIANNSGRSLLNVINDILDYSKIAAGKMELENTPFYLESLVNESVSLFSIYAHEKHINLFMSMQPDVPKVVVGDPTRLRQVIANLVSNALKFTEHGEIAVRISLPNPTEKQKIKFSISDTGIGINEAGLKKLFKSFSQADNTTTRRFGGTGLGLAISQEFVQMMGGHIQVTSELNKGTVFSFVLDLKIHQESEPEVEAELPLKNLRLLFVDQCTTYCAVMIEQLIAWGVIAIGATKAQQAFEVVNEQKMFDTIIIDVSFDMVDSLNLVEKIRQLPDGEKINIILLKSYQQIVDAKKIKDLNIHTVVVKPTAPYELRELLSLKYGDLTHDKSQQETTFDTYPYLKVLVAEDNKVNQLVISALLQKLNIKPDLVENGKQALTYYKRNILKPYDLILMDIEMPEMDGFTAAKRIRDLESTHHVRKAVIFALSAHALKEHEQASLNAGMDAHLNKPIDFKSLSAALKKSFNY